MLSSCWQVYGTNYGRDSCDKLAVLLEKQQEINSTRPTIPDAPNHTSYIHYPSNGNFLPMFCNIADDTLSASVTHVEKMSKERDESFVFHNTT